MKDKYGYIIVSIVLFVEILALITFILCGGDMCIKNILWFLGLNIVILVILLVIFLVTNLGINLFCNYTGKTVFLAEEDLHYKCKFESAREIYIAKDVTNIPYKYFSNLDEYLQYIMFEGENTVIDKNAFEKCKNLKRVYLPRKLQEIKDETFQKCKNLKCVTIPDSVTKIGVESFAGCSSLTSVTIGSEVKEIGMGAFKDCKKLKSVTIPAGVTRIETGAFAGCKGLTNITIGSGVEEIGVGAFQDCKKLKSVTIPDNVTKIGAGAFAGCKGLTNVTFEGEGTWFYTDKNDYTGGEKINDISDLKKNAKKLRKTHCNKYWYKKQTKGGGK